MSTGRNRRRSAVASAIAGAVLLALLLAWAVRPAPLELRTGMVERGRFELTIDEEGLTRVADRYLVSAPIAGQVSRARLQVGDAVTPGLVLAQIVAQPPTMLDWRTLTGLRERAAAAATAVSAAVASRDRAAAALAMVQAELDRNRELAVDGFISDAAIQMNTLQVEERRQALLAAELAVESAAHEHAAARAALLQSGAEGAEGAAGVPGTAALPLRSPIAGRILKVLQENESFVAAGTPLYEIADPGRVEVVVDVLSQDASSIQPGMGARLSFDLGEPRHPARVRRVEPVARTKVSALGVEEQRVRVILDLEPDATMPAGDGWRVNASILVQTEDQAVLVPNGALVKRGEAWSVFVLDSGRARVQPVRVAARNARSGWIRDGLSPGQSVVLYPPANLDEGARVKSLAVGG